ncbi:MAG: 2Fe-2S iron-sulfur cluster binding domain-containing protein [Rhizobiales bacterium]|nr:2Fe-2S iron-sulfur cluster binding domain-containing protein [Hyphomicrobiales bacterium]
MAAERTSPRHRITIANRGGRIVLVGEDETILDVCEREGLALPVACRYGGCITCAGRLLSGRVRQPGGTALNRRQSKAGYVLLCVAHPRTDCTVEVGVETHDDLHRNPFAGRGA